MRSVFAVTLVLSVYGLWGGATLRAEETIEGERLDPSLYGPSVIESMEAALDRDRLAPPPENSKERQGRNGVWMVPSRGATTFPHSGEHNAVNKWGDTRMGIGFGRLVDVHGAYFAGQAGEGVWTTAIRAIGYRDGQVTQETDWFYDIGAEPQWFAMNLSGVDRIEIVSVPVVAGGGWYGMDDLTYSPVADSDETPAARIVVDFDDLGYRTKLTGSGYAGLIWETGRGDFSGTGGVHGPMVPPDLEAAELPPGSEPPEPSRSAGTLPMLLSDFQAVIRGDAGSWSYPPDSDGAIGPDHYLETVNRNFAVYDKETGAELMNLLLGSFLPGCSGDPRVLFDQHSERWIVIVTDFSATATIFLAVSLTDDPTGDWFKTSFVTAQGADAGRWPDYPTLGVDANGIYTTAYMVGGGNMTIFAIDKAPLIDPSPSLGTITAFRDLPWKGAIQPAHTYGTPGGEYLVSWFGSTSLHVRRIDPPLTSPTLTDMGTVSVPYFNDPPNAPALGSFTPLHTVDKRLMMSVYRDGSLWTCHTINVDGRAGCRWYELDPASPSLIQSGTVADSSLYYFFPSIMVNQFAHVVMGFTGSNSDQYAACYYTGRISTDPAGEMAPPAMFKEGTGPQNNIDPWGRNRWGDYSYTTLDPLDQTIFWTIQEYGHGTDIWGTWIGQLTLVLGPLLPDPAEFWFGPTGASAARVDMGAVLTTGGIEPAQYFFEFVSGGLGGDDSGWLDYQIYYDFVLEANTLYSYRVKARDDASPPEETEYSTAETTATRIEKPTGVAFGTVTSNSVVLNATGTLTKLTVGDSGVHFDSTTAGGDGGINQWIQTTTDTATGLSPDTLYSFQVKARNQLSVETSYTDASGKATLAEVPAAPVLSNETCASMDVAIGADGNPAVTSYAIRCSDAPPPDASWDGQYVDATGNPSVTPVYQTKAGWGTTTVVNLAAATTYTFEVNAKNQEGVETAPGLSASLTTSYGDGDFELDDDVDLADFAAFQRCFGQEGIDECAPGNMTGDEMIDLEDFAEFYASLIGPA